MFSTQTSNVGEPHRRLSFDAASEENSDDIGGSDATLEEAAEREHEYLRRRLRDELQREPTEEELNEWLREHTEGY
jgi:HEPN domain-containing protein